jgi:SAM-dependent methyltransferase
MTPSPARRPGTDVAVTYRSEQPPTKAFATLVLELTDGLARAGISLSPKAGGDVRLGDSPLGSVTTWNVGKEIAIRWHAMPWGGSTEGTVRVRFEEDGTGSRVSWSIEGWAGLFSEPPAALPDWAAADLMPSLLGRLVPDAVGDWFTDRRARRPGGSQSRGIYRDPTFHWPNFWLILDRIRLTPDDRLLEVGCGGGAFLHQALQSGCTATGVDHSPQMVALARGVNAEALRAGRADVLAGDAGHLPVGTNEYTCCVSTGAIGFFPDTLAALKEMHRALAPGGRLALYAGTAALRGTPAAPEPVASRIRFFEGPELAKLARRAGFANVVVEDPDMEPFARRAGVPEEAMPLFRGTGSSLLLLAKKSNPARPRSRR